MATVSNISLIQDVGNILRQYVSSYAVTNGYSANVYDFVLGHPNVYKTTSKPLVCIYNITPTENIDPGMCDMATDVRFTIAIRKLDKNADDFLLQVGYTRELFANNGAMRNRFSGNFGGAFSNKKLMDFGITNVLTGAYNESFDQNDTYHVMNFMATVRFAKNLSPNQILV